jgi:hypothetical protein
MAIALGLAAAAVAAAVIAPRVGPEPRVRRSGGSTVALSAHEVLLAAARHAEQQPAGLPGQYWWVRTIDGQAWQVGPAGHPYVVEERVEHQVWQRRTPQDGYQEVVSVRSLGAHPQTAADVAAWRRDGSPSRWVVTLAGSTPQGAARPSTLELRTRPSRPEVTTTSIPCLVRRGEPVPQHGICVRIDFSGRVPTDPAKLADALTRDDLSQDPAGATGALFLLAGGQIFSGGGPIMGKPMTPAVRAAVYRALAALPGVRSLGPTRDPLGRQGEGISTTARRDSDQGRIERRLIIDPVSGRLLAMTDEALTASTNSQWASPGEPVTWTALVQAGWTDEAPKSSADIPAPPGQAGLP